MATQIMARDRQARAITDFHHVVPINFLCPAIGEKYATYRNRVSKLTDIGYLHLAPGQKIDRRGTSGYTRKKFLLYMSGEQKGYQWGPHTLMQALIELNFHIAAPKLGLAYHPWPYIQALPETPHKTANSQHPLKLSVERDGETFHFAPDGHNWHLEGPTGDVLSFLLEADRNNEGNRNYTEKSRPFWEAKFRNYLAFTKKGKDGKSPAQLHFGFPSTFLLVVSNSPLKLANLQKLLLELTDERGAPNILFKFFPDYEQIDGALHPDTSFVSDPWARAGFEPFDIVEKLGGKVIR